MEEENLLPEPSDSLRQCRKWFQAAVDSGKKWREEAKEDFEFTAGKQWTEDELKIFREEHRPAIVINRILPLINILSGYQRLNRYDIDFLARTNDDVELCQVRRGMTKYIMDRSDYDAVESQVFLDCAIGGLGWFGVRYKIDNEIQDGEAVIERIDPFGIYVDPEAHELDFSDAKFLIRAKWVAKDELKQVYPEQADAIENNFAVYDSAEEDGETRPDIDPLYYSSELQKVRVVECWYREHGQRTIFLTVDGQPLSQEQVTPEMINAGMIADSQDIPTNEVKLCVFFDRTLLEEITSPYQHGKFPYVPMVYHYYGVGDTPAGFVRAMKDPQRELNKRRIQTLHLLNTSANGGGWIEEGAMTPDQESEFERKGTLPGHFQKVMSGAISMGKIREREPTNPPTAVIQAEQAATEDLKAISGINESLLGVDVPSQASGRAIELRQKQAVTHLAVIFDSLRRAKKKIANLLWGRRGHAGIVPQFYTAEKVYRVEGENGQQFITINEQVAVQDPIAGTIIKTLNDLSQGEFDIVISDVESSTTQRQAQMWSLVDAASKLGIPHESIFETLIDLSDLPKKNDIKMRWQQQQQIQQEQIQAQQQHELELERVKNADFRMQIAFKDAPLPIQFAMAAQAGLIDRSIADYFIQTMVQQMAPQLAMQMNQQVPPQQMPQVPLPQMQQMPVQQPQENPAAVQSAMNGIMPAAM
ncbi:MAG: hypothetical protein IJK81_13395 [Selenomonadaceae bacterium]|nr:hypothetical protein [Selenomonadaceae bacterium]